jgi:acyl carrier protein
VVSTGDLQTRIDQWIKLESLRDTEKTRQQTETRTKIGSSSDHPRLHLQSAYAVPQNELEQAITDIWKEVLGIEQVGIQENFFNLGGHSLMALQVLSRLRRAFQVEVSVRVFFEVPTVAGLAKAIEQSRLIKEKDDKDLAQILIEVERLSEDQVKGVLHKCNGE